MKNTTKKDLVLKALTDAWTCGHDNPVRAAKAFIEHSPRSLDHGGVDCGGVLFKGDFEMLQFLKSFGVRCSNKTAPTIYRKLVGLTLEQVANSH